MIPKEEVDPTADPSSPKEDTDVENGEAMDNLRSENVHTNDETYTDTNYSTCSDVKDIETSSRKSTYEDSEDVEQDPVTKNDENCPLTIKNGKYGDIPEWMWTEYERETRCGMYECQPDCLQKLASKKTYIVVHGLLGMFNSAVYAYHNSSISTVEKRFKISSRTSGLTVSAIEMGSLSFSLIMSYLGSRSHKTRWIGCGAFIVALSCFVRLLPHLLYGAGEDAHELTWEYGTSPFNSSVNSSKISSTILCTAELEEDCPLGGTTSTPAIILFFSFYIMGLGASMYYTLGYAYLDDNVRKDKAAFILSLTQCIKMLGPTFGYLLGSYALMLYIDTSAHPTITSDDPRWLGAWWLGWGPLGVVGLVIALAIAQFPLKLPRAAQRAYRAAALANNENKIVKTQPERSLKDFKQVLGRLIKNRILLCNTLSTVLFAFAFIGYWIFMPKYLETQFRQSAAKSSFITGTVGLVFYALGVMASGSVISKFQPRARYLAAWNVLVECLDILGYIFYSVINCTVDDLHGSPLPDGSWNLTAACNSGCDCGDALKYAPVCSLDRSTTFYSACHAGCTTMEMMNGTKMYGNCSCIGGDSSGWATEGVCPVDCSTKFAIYLVVKCFLTFFGASGRTGNMIIQFRCVDPDDKSVAMGFMDAILCSLALIPGPIVFGILMDSACLVWGQTCGESGNCWLYDGQKLGFRVNFMTAGCLLLGTLLDIGVWYFVKGLQIYDKEELEKAKQKKLRKKLPPIND